jgi:hypothetical protein
MYVLRTVLPSQQSLQRLLRADRLGRKVNGKGTTFFPSAITRLAPLSDHDPKAPPPGPLFAPFLMDNDLKTRLDASPHSTARSLTFAKSILKFI